MIVDSVDTIGGTSWLGVFILAYVTQVLHQDASWWGFMNASFFSGTILGGLLVVGLVKRLQRNSFLYMLGALLVYVLITVVFALNTIPVAALVLLLYLAYRFKWQELFAVPCCKRVHRPLSSLK